MPARLELASGYYWNVGIALLCTGGLAAPPHTAGTKPSRYLPAFMAKSSDGLTITFPIRAPGAELEGASELGETRWAARVCAGAGCE